MNEVVLTQSGTFDFRNLSEVELEVLVQVIQKDFEIKASEKARLRRHRRKLKEADERVSILANSNFNESFCVICFKRFVVIFFPKRCCLSCRHCMCRDCSVWIPRDQKYICLLCQSERTLKSMGCDWYYGLLKNKFQHDASELVAQSLYSNQGQYPYGLLDSIITPDLLQKVKGAQISRYRQKIQYKWEEMQERLRRVDLNEINTVRREETYRAINDEYKGEFKDILKEFSQVLYITLENYAAKTENFHININEQVMETVHEEVELLIGYKINLVPEEMQSVMSDVESTASMFMGNQLEERLALALINKINEDHRKVYDMNDYDVSCLDNIKTDDQSSTTTYLYRAPPNKDGMHNGIRSSCRSSMTTSNIIEDSQYKMDALDYSRRGNSYFSDDEEMTNAKVMPQQKSENKFDTESEIISDVTYNTKYDRRSNVWSDVKSNASVSRSVVTSEVSLSATQVQRIMSHPNVGPQSLTERSVNVPVSDPINLFVELNGFSGMEIVWTKTTGGHKKILKNDRTIEILKSSNGYVSTSNLRIWDSVTTDTGLYTAYTNNRSVAEFCVRVLESTDTPKKPIFRLKMLNCSVRNGQNAEFSVEAIGYPEPRVVFYHNNTILNIPSDKYSLDHMPSISRVNLRINKVAMSDKGTYKCVASNDVGYCECFAELQVTHLNFRFEKKEPTHEYSSGSSIDDNTPIPQTNDKPDFVIAPDNVFDSNASVNQLVEIHQHLTYLEWQLDWFEEQTLQGDKSSINGVSNDFTSDTVIGREVPDDITGSLSPSPMRRFNTLPRSNSLQSDESGDLSPTTARANALRRATFSPSNNSSYVAKIRERFDTTDSPFQRSESITKRTPPSGKRKQDTQLTREVRIRRYDMTKD